MLRKMTPVGWFLTKLREFRKRVASQRRSRALSKMREPLNPVQTARMLAGPGASTEQILKALDQVPPFSPLSMSSDDL